MLVWTGCGTDECTALVDELAIWQRGLSPSEIVYSMLEPLNVADQDGLVVYYNFDNVVEGQDTVPNVVSPGTLDASVFGPSAAKLVTWSDFDSGSSVLQNLNLGVESVSSTILALEWQGVDHLYTGEIPPPTMLMSGQVANGKLYVVRGQSC